MISSVMSSQSSLNSPWSGMLSDSCLEERQEPSNPSVSCALEAICPPTTPAYLLHASDASSSWELSAPENEGSVISMSWSRLVLVSLPLGNVLNI